MRMTEGMYEELKRAIFNIGVNAVEEAFDCGVEFHDDNEDDLLEAIDEVLEMMPEEIALNFYDKYCRKKQNRRGEVKLVTGQRILIDSSEFQKRVMKCITTEEIDKFFKCTDFADVPKCRQAMIHGMCIAAMLTSDCDPIIVNFVSAKDEGNDNDDTGV